MENKLYFCLIDDLWVAFHYCKAVRVSTIEEARRKAKELGYDGIYI